MMIHEGICTYEVVKLAKEKGFPVKEIACWYCEYDGRPTKEIIDEQQYPIITQSLLQRWLREKKGIHIEIVATACGYYWIADKINGTTITDSDILDRGINEGGCFDTYEEALEDALKYTLENLI
jgi:hypothetical protein